jgi:hypothetical protein
VLVKCHHQRPRLQTIRRSVALPKWGMKRKQPKTIVMRIMCMLVIVRRGYIRACCPSDQGAILGNL